MAKNQHVIPYEGEWAVIGEGNARVTSIHRTQAEAIEAGRRIARAEQAELIIHRLDGRIRDRDSYGNDPLPPKAPRKVQFPAKPNVTDPGKIRAVVREIVSDRSQSNNPLHESLPSRDQKQ